MGRRSIAVCPRAAALSLALAGAASVVSAQTPSLGPEFPVNTYTTSAQEVASIASAGDGTFVVVWDSSPQDGSYTGVFGQRFDGTGARAGAEFQVNTYTTGHQFSAQVGADAQGNFVVAWATAPALVGSGPEDVMAQRFDASGTKLGPEFRVNTYTTGAQNRASVAVASAGDFVVVWSSYGQASGYDVFGQRFNAAGAKVGPEFRVNTYSTGAQYSAHVAMSRSGEFVVVWVSVGQDGSAAGIFGQRFDASGTKRGGEFSVNGYTTGYQNQAAVAMDRGGNFVVAWNSDTEDQVFGIFAQRFDASGAKVGPEFGVNVYTTNGQYSPAVAMDARGNFVVAWHGDAQGGSADDIAARRFDRAGRPVSPDFLVNAQTANFQSTVALADTGRGFVAAWTGPDASGNGVFGRRERLAPEGLVADAHGFGPSDLNGVLEPGEAAIIEPLWTNAGADLGALSGATAAVTGPPGPIYTLLDGTADYGAVASEAETNCVASGFSSCFAVQIGGTRPATHWDAEFTETLDAGGSQVWKLHLGDSFSDVPRSEPFYKKIETLLHNGITAGCNATQYCPAAVVSRDAMAIFVAKGIASLGEYVPSAGQVGAAPYNCAPGGHSLFADVAPTASFCKHVHYLAAQNVTLGCDATHYCPGQSITRDAMASFIAKAVVAPGGGSAVPVSYTDPTTSRSYSCVSGSANLHFTDVPVSNAFCKHVHYLWARGIVDGCTATKYCPTAAVARDAMAKFIANGFGLQLYGP